MTKEKQFEERLNSLVLLKALLIKDNEFDEVAQKKGILSYWKQFLNYYNSVIILIFST